MKTNRAKSITGFTLLELMIVLAIIGILFGYGIPSFVDLYRQAKANHITNRLIGLVHYAKHEAMMKNHIITLCGSDNSETCSGDWSENILVFTDYNGDGSRQTEDTLTEEPILQIEQLDLKTDNKGSIHWRSFRNKKFLQLFPKGMTYYQNGNFTFCPDDGDIRYARHMILNRAAYLRVARDNDGDGIPEKANGEAISCEA